MDALPFRWERYEGQTAGEGVGHDDALSPPVVETREAQTATGRSLSESSKTAAWHIELSTKAEGGARMGPPVGRTAERLQTRPERKGVDSLRATQQRATVRSVSGYFPLFSALLLSTLEMLFPPRHGRVPISIMLPKKKPRPPAPVDFSALAESLPLARNLEQNLRLVSGKRHFGG